ncbi:MAG: sensor histidine kinase [Bacteroidia bacterium]
MEPQNDISIYLALVAGTEAMLLISVGIVLFVVVYQKRLVKQQEEKNQLEIQHQRKLAESILTSIEKERRRIAADLHDEVGHSLLLLRLNMRNNDPTNENRNMIDQSINSLRRISFDLYPPAIETLGIMPAIEDLLNEARKNKFMIKTDISCDIDKLEQYTSLTLYRIVQELLSNTIKYSQAKTISYAMWNTAEELFMEYHDDGVGFDLEHKKNSMGLLNLSNRVETLHGKTHFETSPNNGFKMRLTIPLPPKQTETHE